MYQVEGFRGKINKRNYFILRAFFIDEKHVHLFLTINGSSNGSNWFKFYYECLSLLLI